MVGDSNKILTVSYGTFSCTLEGFDDPFSTMRGIAEYFRDLAADDRYFGAEPPTPDVEMLQKIAEKEVHNRVEKRLNDGGVVLRQVSGPEAEEAPAAPFEQGDASEDSVAEAADAAEEEVGAELTEASEEVAGTDADSVEVDEPEAEDAEDTEAEVIADAPEGVEEAVAKAVEAEATDDADVEAVAEEQDAAEDSEPSEQDDTVEVAAEEEPDLVAEGADEASDEAEDEVVSDALDAIHAFESEEAAPVASRPLSTPLEIFTEQLESITSPGTEKDEELQDSATTEEAPEAEFEPAEADDAAPAPVSDDTSFQDKLARIQAAVAATPDFDTDFEAESGFEEDVEAAPVAEFDDAGDTDMPETDSLETDDVLEGFEVAAEVVTLKREDMTFDAPEENAFAEDTQEEDADAVVADAPLDAADDNGEDLREALGETSLSDDDESDLAAKLAQIDTAVADAPEEHDAWADDDAEADDADALRAERARPISRPLDEHDESEGVSRLLEEADHQFQDDESSRRRSAIAHLKAAVAATKADDLIRVFKGRGEETDAEEQSAYRDDLSRVVKPQSSEDVAARTGADMAEAEEDQSDADAVDAAPLEAEDEAPAPLMLVSEQRVDHETPPFASGPVHPKHPTVNEDEAGFGKDSGFVSFARDMGAKELPELLEAAAAYTAFVEGEPHFSRPEIMRRVARSDLAEGFSREAGLRTFGQLLRQGRLQKLRRGQFVVSADTRFNPDSRIAGE